MDYLNLAAQELFGGPVIDNALRGCFIEALVMAELRKLSEASDDDKSGWRHTGKGWGPWDFQRGTAAGGDRVRVQVKVKAAKQLWNPTRPSRNEFDLRPVRDESLPRYFARDFPAELFGCIELVGYRCDLYLLVWHGGHSTASNTIDSTQSDPNQYDYFIVPVRTLSRTRYVNITQLYQEYQPIKYRDVAFCMNAAADDFLSNQKLKDSQSAARAECIALPLTRQADGATLED